MSSERNHLMDGEEFRADGALTFKLCFDQMKDIEDISGRIYCGYERRYIYFRRLNDGLCVLKRVLFQARAGYRCEVVFSKENGLRLMEDTVRYWNSMMLHRVNGALGNAYLYFDASDDVNALWKGAISVMVEKQVVYYAAFSRRCDLKKEILKIGTILCENDDQNKMKLAFRAYSSMKHDT